MKPARVIGEPANARLGHIAMGPERQATLSFAEEARGVLKPWVWETTELDPEGARQLAAALVRWAERTDRLRAGLGADARPGAVRTCKHCSARVTYVLRDPEVIGRPRWAWSDGTREPYWCPDARSLEHAINPGSVD